MRCLMSENQRQAILSAIPASGRMLEWGSGGSTLWLADRINPAQSIISVEHEPEWAREVAGAIGKRTNWNLILARGALEVGRNATQWEECPAGLGAYIDPGISGSLRAIDVFLIDGVARGACLMNVLLKAMPGAVIFVHDTQRDWYEWAIATGAGRILSRERIDPTPGDYPSVMTKLVLL